MHINKYNLKRRLIVYILRNVNYNFFQLIYMKFKSDFMNDVHIISIFSRHFDLTLTLYCSYVPL